MMRAIVFALALGTVATQVLADDPGQPFRNARQFWNSGLFPQKQLEQPAPRFTTTYTAGLARRLGLGDGQGSLFEQQPWGRSGPSLGAGFENGNAEIKLRWHPGQ